MEGAANLNLEKNSQPENFINKIHITQVVCYTESTISVGAKPRNYSWLRLRGEGGGGDHHPIPGSFIRYLDLFSSQITYRIMRSLVVSRRSTAYRAGGQLDNVVISG